MLLYPLSLLVPWLQTTKDSSNIFNGFRNGQDPLGLLNGTFPLLNSNSLLNLLRQHAMSEAGL